MFQQIYHSKLLLFGEHSLLQGSQALAVPYATYGGKWSFDKQDSSVAKESNGVLKELSKYLKTQPVNGFEFREEKMEMVLGKGLWFDSSIPQGYGVGSSGALCAAVYAAFGLNRIEPGEGLSPFELLKLKGILGGIESFFHGASSGIDPLISYLNQSVMMRSQSEMYLTWPDKGIPGASIFLINTGISRKTSPYVQRFISLYENEKFKNLYHSSYVNRVNFAIQSYLEKQGNALLESVRDISIFQYRYMRDFIPEKFQELWKEGLEESSFSLKLCGAGGGGFILGFCKDFDTMKTNKPELKLERLE